jgi:hypothetical protein
MAPRTSVTLFLVFAMSGCGRASPVPVPKTRAEFIAAYRAAYNAGDKPAVMAMVKWDGVPDDLRRVSEMALTLWIGKHQITSIELVTYEPDPNLPMEIDGRKLESNLPPTYWLVATHEGREGYENSKSTGSVKYAVGIDKGVLRFCGVRWVGP